MTKIDYIKAKLDFIKFGLSGFLGGFFLIVVAIYTEDDLFTKIVLSIILIIIGIALITLINKYTQIMEKLN